MHRVPKVNRLQRVADSERSAPVSQFSEQAVTEDSQLDPPAQALSETRAIEILRVWAGTEQLHVTLRTAWDDPAGWGLVLADIARHVVNAYSQAGGGDPVQIAQRIRNALDAEWADPTSDARATPYS